MTTFYVRIDKVKTVLKRAETEEQAIDNVYMEFMHKEPNRKKYFTVERKKKVLTINN